MDGELRNMVMRFRVTELQALLGHAGKNKTGRKNELQSRALELVKSRSPQISIKIRELYRSIALTNYGQPLDISMGSAASPPAVKGGSSSSSTSYGSAGYDMKVGQDPINLNSFGRSVGYHRVIGGDGQYKSIPICPDIKMKELPFYDILAVLLRPTSLINQGQCPKQETQHSFCLSPSQAGEITNSREVIHSEGGYAVSKIQYLVQVQLRFCALDSTDEQDDLFPQGLVVKVNGRPVQLPTPIPSNRPGVEPKRPSKPLNITSNVRCCPLSTNTIHVSWIADLQKNYCMLINIVKKLTADQLFSRLKAKRIQPADFTRGRIKEITTAEEDDLCAPTSIRVSVACPLGKSRMTYPCRATTCKHLQCFDANLFLLMNERKPTFVCPVCNKHLKFGDLCIDGYFMDVIKNLSIDAGNDIELFPDGTWVPAIKVKNETEDVGPPAKKMKPSESASKLNKEDGLNETIDLDDDIIIEDDIKPSSSTSSSSNHHKSAAAEPEVIDLLDSSDEEEDNDNDNTRQSGSSSAQVSSPQMQNQDAETVHSVASQQQQDDDDDDEEEIGIRPRRRKTKVSYVEESSSDSSSTNEGDSTPSVPSSTRQPRSPACIELSDSPTPSPESLNNQQGRPFASLGSSSTAASSTANNNRSGSGSSSTTLYSSSGIGTTAAPGASTSAALHHHYQPPYYSATSTFSISSSFSPSGQTGPSSASASSSSTFFPSNMSTPGYTAYDGSARMIHSSNVPAAAMSGASSWDDDLNSLINPQSLNYGSLDALPSTPSLSLYDDFLNAAASGRHPFSTTTSSSIGSMYDPNSGAAAGGYARWM